ncbi:MAG: NUDIX hydrolase [Nocardioides sp.]
MTDPALTPQPGARPRRRTKTKEKDPRVQRVAAYAVIIRATAAGEEMLLSRLSDELTSNELWTLPGGGVEHGEDPRTAAVREVHEETGLVAEVSESARVFSFHQKRAWRRGRRVDAHAVRIVYDGWVAKDAPEPHTLEVDGSTAEARWVSLDAVSSGAIPTVSLVRDALAAHQPTRVQRVAAYALIRRDDSVLLTRISSKGFHAGSWTLPGGGIDFGESPQDALVREVEEETGLRCTVGEVIAVDDVSIRGSSPAGRWEEFHGVHLIFAAEVADQVAVGVEPRVVEVDGTTDAVAWVRLDDVGGPQFPVLDVVRTALG